jgi:hypothetical protein
MRTLVCVGGGFACALACAASDPRDPFTSGGASQTAGATDGVGEEGGSGSGATDGATSGATTPDDTSAGDETDGGIKLDVNAFGDTPPPGCVGDEECGGCTFVDLLFVIDNSGSMGDYQEALGLAFPQFAATLVSALPPGTNVHVGVTSTEMGYSGSGNTMVNNGVCTFIGDGDQPHTAFYITPDVTDSGRNGAQGRLYEALGQPYFDFDTDAGAATLQELEDWFTAAANIGEGGSNIEMSAAPVGWVADPANAATNDGFLRDEGAVLVVLFMQDEPDQTPPTIDGQPGGQFVLERISEAKAGCGGTDCIIAGGFLDANACSATGNLPLDDFLAGVSITPVVQALPNVDFGGGNAQQAADEMNEMLSNTLAEVIVQTCDEIEPAG